MKWFDNKVNTSLCSECPHRLQLLITGDCPEINTSIELHDIRCETDFDSEPNQICHAACKKGSALIKTRKFFKLPPEYWRKRFLLEHMHWPYNLLK